MSDVKLIGWTAMNHVISHQEGVKARVKAEATKIAGKAEAKLKMHRHSGAAKITQTSGDVDEFVNLDDKAALSIEFGHWVKGKYETHEPKFVPGLYILTGAAGLLN